MPFIDAHAHMSRFPGLHAAVAEAKAAGALAIVSSGFDLESSRISASLAQNHPCFVHACVGIAPPEAMKMSEKEFGEAFSEIKKLSASAVAIGEIGLDRHWPATPGQAAMQKKCFLAQLEFAQEKNLPVVIHSRDAEAETVETLLASGAKKALLHYFSGSAELAKKAAEAGYHFTIPPVASASRAKMIRAIPLNQLLTESDAPYVGKTPSSCLKSAQIIAEAKGISIDETLTATTQNAERFYALSERGGKT